MSEPGKLPFRPVDPADYDMLYPYTSAFGEGSCQHSPVSMVSLAKKYGDCVCVENGVLYTLRSRLCDDTYRVYLAPLGGEAPGVMFGRILEDAAAYGKKVKFVTLTEKAAASLKEAFPDRFDYLENRDLAEYMISWRTMAEFPGKLHARRRTEIRSFWRDYGDRAEVREMTPADLDAVLAFAGYWFEVNSETHDEKALQLEMSGIRKQLAHFSRWRLSGTVLRLDGRIIGFCYGTKLNDTCYDVLIEKGVRDIPGVYRVLRQESTKLNVSPSSYINFEEDLGIPGLRKIKESYDPAFLLAKYIVTERQTLH